MNTYLISRTPNSLIIKGLKSLRLNCEQILIDKFEDKIHDINNKVILFFISSNEDIEFLNRIKGLYPKAIIIPVDKSYNLKNIMEIANLGIEDYFCSPLDFDILAKRIVKRYTELSSDNINQLKYNDIVLCMQSINCNIFGNKIKLSKQEFKLLEFFMRNPDRIFKKQYILESVWDFNTNILTNSLDVHISKLRKKIDPEKKLFHTIHGTGYYFGNRNN